MIKTISETNSKRILNDICVIRIILILLLIIYHSLCPYTSPYWDNPQGVNIPVYYWIGRFSYSCMLETFVFISGVILGFQTKKDEKYLSFNYLVIGKLRRLILPSILFGLIYFMIFMDFSYSPTVAVKSIFEGVGHMWFLPMLFWCFLFLFIINIIGINRKGIIPILLIIAVFSSLPLPLRMSQSMYYFFFFFAGYRVGTNDIDVTKYFTKKMVLFMTIFFLLTFPILAHIRYGYDDLYIANKMGGVFH